MNTTYTVKPGDSIYGIAKQYGVDAIDIINLNNLDGYSIQVGQVLQIPNNQGTSTNATFIYTVKPGDNIYSLAKIYETTPETIKKYNNLTSDNLSIGQKLIVPELDFVVTEKPSYTRYTVKQGDNLYDIANKFNVDVETIIKDNALKNNVLAIGQVLNIRTPKENIVTEEACYGPGSNNINYSNNTTQQTYTVKQGDNLYDIAKKFNTSVDSIKKKNNLTSNNLSISQKLII